MTAEAKEESVTVPEHRRRKKRKPEEEVDAEKLRFDESVPVEEIRLPNPEVDEADETQEITEKVTYRLAQRPASYVILKYIRPVVKKKDGSLSCPAAPPSVLGPKSIRGCEPFGRSGHRQIPVSSPVVPAAPAHGGGGDPPGAGRR